MIRLTSLALAGTSTPALAAEPKFQRQVIDDGKLEIIATGRATKNVVIYWNKN